MLAIFKQQQKAPGGHFRPKLATLGGKRGPGGSRVEGRSWGGCMGSGMRFCKKNLQNWMKIEATAPKNTQNWTIIQGVF